ncbi:MAG: hypothetical protein WAS05_00270 [Candidatus Nanopelagicales bacterium]
MRIGYAVDSGAVVGVERHHSGPGLTSTSIWGATMRYDANNTLDAANYGIPSPNAGMSIRERLHFTVTTPCEIAVQMAQGVSNATATQMLAGSFLEARRVG